MMLNLAVAQRAQYLDADGKPLSMGRLTFYEQGSATVKKAIYADPYGNVQLENPLPLDVGGFVPPSGVFYGAGNYTIKVEKCLNPLEVVKSYATEYTIPDVPGTAQLTATDVTVLYVKAVEDLHSLQSGTFDYVFCAQYYNDITPDAGGGWFKWIASSNTATNLGYVFACDDSPSIGRMVRLGGSQVLASEFGVCGVRNANNYTRLQQGFTWAQQNDKTFVMTPGNCQIDGTLTFLTGNILIQKGFFTSVLTPGQPSILIFNGTNVEIDQTTDSLCSVANGSRYVKFLGISDFKVYPEWFGAIGDGVADDYEAIYLLSLSDGVKVFRKTYLIEAIGRMTSTQISVGSAYFEAGSRMINRIDLVDFAQISADKNALWILQGDETGDLQYYTFHTQIKAQWLFNLTPNAVELGSALVVANASCGGFLTWDYPGTFTLPTSITGGGSRVSHYVAQGTYLDFKADINLGNITSGPWTIFANSATSIPYINLAQKAQIRIEWWGFWDDREALIGAMRTGARNGAVIIGNANGLTLGAAAPIPSGDVILRDMKIYSLISAPFTTDIAACNLTLQNCQFSNNLYFAITGKAIVQNCTILNEEESPDNSLIASGGVFINGLFMYRRITNPIPQMTYIRGGRTITGISEGDSITIQNPAETVMYGNSISKLYVSGTSPSTVCNGLSIIDNIIGEIDVGANMATYGHIAQIHSNVQPSGLTLKSTRTLITLSEVIAGGFVFEAASTDAKITAGRIFPYEQNPKFAIGKIVSKSSGGTQYGYSGSAVSGISTGTDPNAYYFSVTNDDVASRTVVAKFEINWEK